MDENTIILNREWIYNDVNGDPVGSTDFEVPMEWLLKVYPILFPDGDPIEEFLDWYTPEEDGERIYQQAVKDGVLIQEGIAVY